MKMETDIETEMDMEMETQTNMETESETDNTWTRTWTWKCGTFAKYFIWPIVPIASYGSPVIYHGAISNSAIYF
jgi:hypothetical protein